MSYYVVEGHYKNTMMNFEAIETCRLILKEISPDDMKYIFENLTKPEIKKIP